jgi:hypothetical protein
MVWYYAEPVYEVVQPQTVPANQEANLMIKTDFKWTVNNKERIYEHGQFRCRFTSFDGKQVVYTNATIMTYPISEEGDPNAVSCKSPNWEMDSTKTEEMIKLEITINGVDYSGSLTVLISEDLNIFKIVPLCGPNEGNTRV